ncbi:hypothetical protein F7725_005423 [Dissostichus mawsoni]|uniref:SEA domain-containing protein n=1 Tax=Dissostichus mawsoni TaxID=36200 RepID=A0A7J5YVA0_DISMA|nr:hypothetical protein F7725_005423 [Dissostichus mawsoni]
MQETFTPQLANKSSPAFLELKNKVTTALDMVYSEQYGSSFNRIVINSFSQGSVVVDAEVIFNDVTTLPNATSVASALATASSSSNFSLTVNVSSISATAVLAPTQTPTTVAPSTPLVNFTSPPLTTAAPSAAPNATAVSTAAPVPLTTTASIISTTSNEGTLALKFSIDQTFTADLSNSSSTAYQTLAAEVVKELNKVCTNLYGSSFVRSVVNSFTSGSVVADTTISFKDTSSVPSSSTATSQLSSALTSNSTSLSQISQTHPQQHTRPWQQKWSKRYKLSSFIKHSYFTAQQCINKQLYLPERYIRQINIHVKQSPSAHNGLFGRVFTNTAGCGTDDDN